MNKQDNRPVRRGAIRRQERRGAAVVEAAVVLAVLIPLIFGALDFALQFHTRHRMTAAAREAARYLAVRDGTEAQATAAALNQLSGYNPALFTISFPKPVDPQDVCVLITVPRSQISIGCWPGGQGAVISARTTMRKEL